jgi:hypothetical protein
LGWGSSWPPSPLERALLFWKEKSTVCSLSRLPPSGGSIAAAAAGLVVDTSHSFKIQMGGCWLLGGYIVVLLYESVIMMDWGGPFCMHLGY